MPFLTAAVILVGALCLVDLLLTVAVIRRLRGHTTQLAELQATSRPLGPRFLAVGSGMPEFSGQTVDGEVLSSGTLAAGPCAVAFLQSSCQPCRDRVPDLRSFAAEMPGGRARVVAVVTGDGDVADGIVDDLREVAGVVSGPHAAAMVTAFEVTGYPTFYAFVDGAVRAAGADHHHLAVLGRSGASGRVTTPSTRSPGT
jgi:thiol-disulfide isomerase/thioredoxin